MGQDVFEGGSEDGKLYVGHGVQVGGGGVIVQGVEDIRVGIDRGVRRDGKKSIVGQIMWPGGVGEVKMFGWISTSKSQTSLKFRHKGGCTRDGEGLVKHVW